MRTGRLIISRGHQLEQAAPPPPRVAPPPLPLYPEIDERLTALERLARLFEQGALDPREFAAEKALILGRYGDENVLERLAPTSFIPAHAPHRRPSLLGRLLGWKLVPVGLAAGLAVSFSTQPVETTNFVNDLRGLAGF